MMQIKTGSNKAINAFISHTGRNKEIAKEIAHMLLESGVDVFFDQNNIQPGDSIFEKISLAISKADVLIILISKDSNNSSWLSSEYSLALSQHKKIIPILVDKDAEVPVFIKSISYLNYSNKSDFNNIKEKLLRAVYTANTTSTVSIDELANEYLSQKVILAAENIRLDVKINKHNKKLFRISSMMSIAGLVLSIGGVLLSSNFLMKSVDSKITFGIIGFFTGLVASFLAAYLMNIFGNKKNGMKHVEGPND